MTLNAKLISTFTTLGSVCVDTAVILRRLVLVSRKSEYKEAVEGGETVNERQKTRVRFVGGWGISLPTAQLHPHKGGIDIPTKPRKSIFPTTETGKCIHSQHVPLIAPASRSQISPYRRLLMPVHWLSVLITIVATPFEVLNGISGCNPNSSAKDQSVDKCWLMDDDWKLMRSMTWMHYDDIVILCYIWSVETLQET